MTVATTTGFSATETTTDKYGRVLAIHNLLTGAESNYEYNDIRVDLPSKLTDKVNLGWDAIQWKISDVINTIKYDSAGNRLSTIEDDRRQTVNQYDPLGELISTSTIGIGQRSAWGMELEYRRDPAGLVFQTIDKSHNWVDALSTYNYDQSTRLWKSTDALTGSEPGTVPATTLLQYDGPLLKAEITDRNGTKSFQWTNSLGQVVKSLSPLGALSSFEYDVFGNRVFERLAEQLSLFIPQPTISTPTHKVWMAGTLSNFNPTSKRPMPKRLLLKSASIRLATQSIFNRLIQTFCPTVRQSHPKPTTPLRHLSPIATTRSTGWSSPRHGCRWPQTLEPT